MLALPTFQSPKERQGFFRVNAEFLHLLLPPSFKSFGYDIGQAGNLMHTSAPRPLDASATMLLASVAIVRFTRLPHIGD